MQPTPFHLLGTYSGWVDLTPTIMVRVVNGDPTMLRCPKEGMAEATDAIEAWIDRGVEVAPTDMGEGDLLLCTCKVAIPAVDKARGAHAHGRRWAEYFVKEKGPVQGAYTWTWRDHLIGFESPFEDLNGPDGAMARSLARIANRAAEARWSEIRREGGKLIPCLKGVIGDLEQEQAVLCADVAHELRAAAITLAALADKISARGKKP